jgi:DNA-binding transcriptional regulator YiaG
MVRKLFLLEQRMTPIREFMKTQKLSNRHMAELTGVTRRTIINWAEGHKAPPLAVLTLITAIKSELISLDWWIDAAKGSKGEQ